MCLQNKNPALAGFLLWRYLADSNRRTRFCRPIPSRSVKVPFAFAVAKVMEFFYSACFASKKTFNCTKNLFCNL